MYKKFGKWVGFGSKWMAITGDFQIISERETRYRHPSAALQFVKIQGRQEDDDARQNSSAFLTQKNKDLMKTARTLLKTNIKM